MEKQVVALVKCDSYNEEETQKAVAQAIELCGGLSDLKDKNVVIKANLLNNFKVETATTAHPSVVLAIAKEIIKRGGKVTVADSSGGLYNKAHMYSVYKATEMTLVKEKCPEITLNENFESTPVYYEKGVSARNFDVISAVYDADVIINVAKLKTHSLTFYTGAVKNLFGIIPGLQKVQIHGANPYLLKFMNYLIDLAEFMKDRIEINFIDAVIGMEGPGPSAGSPRKVGRIIASKNIYAADLVGMSLMNVSPDVFPQNFVQEERDIHPYSMDEIEVKGETVEESKVAGYKLVEDDKAWHVDTMLPKPTRKAVSYLMTPHPKVPRSKCKGCGKCAAHCPPKAITMVKGKATFDYKKCIRCFCCQELCPYHLIKIKRTVFARLLRKL